LLDRPPSGGVKPSRSQPPRSAGSNAANQPPRTQPRHGQVNDEILADSRSAALACSAAIQLRGNAERSDSPDARAGGQRGGIIAQHSLGATSFVRLNPRSEREQKPSTLRPPQAVERCQSADRHTTHQASNLADESRAISGRLHWLVRGRPNPAGTRSDFKPPQHTSLHEDRDAAQPYHPISKRRGARQRARRTTRAATTGALSRKAHLAQLFSFVRLNVRCLREQNPSMW
jgi:hypothetical protein